MSTWTHINGSIRIDGIPMLQQEIATKENVQKIIGNTCSFEDDEIVWDKCTVPCGSEGSLQYEVVKAGDGLTLWTVCVFGDLRDYDDLEEVTGWFNKITKESGLMIRSAILEIGVEGQDVIVLRHEED